MIYVHYTTGERFELIHEHARIEPSKYPVVVLKAIEAGTVHVLYRDRFTELIEHKGRMMRRYELEVANHLTVSR